MSKEDVGNLKVKLGMDSSGFQNGVSNINREMKVMQSSFKLANAEMGKHGTELDSLRLKSGNLTKQADLQRQKVAALEAAHKESVRTKGADSKATQDLEVKLNQARTKLVYMEKDLKSLNQEIEKQSSNWYKMGKDMEKASESMQNTGKKMQDAGKGLSKNVTLPLLGIGVAAVKVGSDFQAGMSEVSAISGAAGADLEKLTGKAKEMGSTTEFSASQSAEALKYMSLAGWQTEQMMQGLPAVLDLAAASNMDLARAADIVTDTMSAFQMGAEDAAKAADIFAATSSKSNTDVMQLGEAMKYAGAAANAAEMSLAQTNTVLGILADSGIKGSMAGTTFTAMLRDMKKNAEDGKLVIEELGKEYDDLAKINLYNANGSMRDLGTLMADVEEATKGMTTQQRDMALGALFGEQALKGANIMLATGAEKYAQLEEAITSSDGAAKKMADTMQDNLQGELTKLRSVLEGVGIQIFEVLVPHLTKLVGKIQEGVAWFAKLNPRTQETIVKFAAMAAAMGPLLAIGGKMVSGAGAIVGAFSKVAIAIAGKTAAAGAAIKAGVGLVASKGLLAKAAIGLTGPVGLAVAAVAALAVGGVLLAKHLKEDSIPAVDLFADGVSDMTKEAVGSFMELNDDATLALNQLAWSAGKVSKDTADAITQNFAKMGEDVRAGLKEHHEKAMVEMNNFFANSKGLSEEEQKEILDNMQQGYEDRTKTIADGEARIAEIMESASNNNRALYRSEQIEINAIQKKMVETGIKVLSENEVESKLIMQRMKDNAGEMSALQAAEVVRNSIVQKEGAVTAAQEQYDQVIREIIRQRDEAGSISEEQADKLILEAQRQKNRTVRESEEMHQMVIAEAQAQAEEHVKHVDWETGEVLSKWNVMKNNIGSKTKEIYQDISRSWKESYNNTVESWSNTSKKMDEAWFGMQDTVKEGAANIVNDMKTRWGEAKESTRENWESVKKSISDSMNNVKSKIAEGLNSIREWNAQRVENKEATFTQRIRTITENIVEAVKAPFKNNYSGTSYFQGGLTMVGEMGKELVELPQGSKIHSDYKTKEMLDGNKQGITQHITINSPKSLSPSEVARKTKQASQQLAMEW